MPDLLSIGRINADVYTTPHADATLDPAPAIIDVFTRARTSIYFAIYSLTHAGIADALIAAHQRGVPIIGVADARELKASSSKVRELLNAGIDVKAWGGASRLMHDKVFVTDSGHHTHVGLGSFNWTAQAEKSNIEVLVIARGIQASRYLAPALTAQIVAAHNGGTPL